MTPENTVQWFDSQSDSIPLVDSVSYALKILEYFSEQTIELSIDAISHRLGLNIKRTANLCQTLVFTGFLVEFSENIFRLGSKAQSMGKIYDKSNPFRSLVALYMKELTKSTGLSTALHVLDRGKGLCIASEMGHAPLVYVVNIGDEVDLLPSAAGRVLLAYSPPEAINIILKESITEQAAEKHALEFDQLQHELINIRHKGFAFTSQEDTDGICSVATPILKKNNIALAALSLIGPSHVFKGGGEKGLIDKILYINLKIKQLMGN